MVIQRPTNTVKLAKAANGNVAPTANTPSVKPLIPSIIVVRFLLKPFRPSFNIMLKAVASEVYPASQVWLTTPVLSVIRSASHKTQLIHNQDVQAVATNVIKADELWSFVKKSKSTVNQKN